jgi:hypothetical protein
VVTHPLLEFLNRCLDEDERLARDASYRNARWYLETVPVKWGEDYVPDILAGGKPILRGSSEYTGVASEHAVRHDPASVLADIAAKRAIIARVKDDAAITDDPLRSQAASNAEWYLATTGRFILRALASAYASRPGYDTDWAPT